MRTTIRDLVEVCDAEVLGDHLDIPIDSAANIDEARANQLAFIAGAKSLGKLASTAASAVLVPKGSSRDGVPAATTLLAVDDPEMAFIACLRHLYPEKPNAGTVSPRAEVDPSASVGEGTSVEGFASIGARASVGRNCRVLAGCRIGDGVTVGTTACFIPTLCSTTG